MNENRPLTVTADDVIVVGTGMAGLITALSLAPRPVTLITKTAMLESGSSLWAKGGIAAAVGPGDTPEAHAEDTLSAGAGLSDPRRALALTREGADSLSLLIHEGVPFDRALDGTLELAREAAHGRPRIVHAGGDATGRVIMSALIERARRTPSIKILRSTFAHDLIVQDGAVRGLIVFEHGKGWCCRHASHVVLATGGIGMAWWHTTNPAESTGDGLAIAARAGAELADLEFMQFHPTALAVNTEAGNANLPLLTEALRPFMHAATQVSIPRTISCPSSRRRIITWAAFTLMMMATAHSRASGPAVRSQTPASTAPTGSRATRCLKQSSTQEGLPMAFGACAQYATNLRYPFPVLPTRHFPKPRKNSMRSSRQRASRYRKMSVSFAPETACSAHSGSSVSWIDGSAGSPWVSCTIRRHPSSVSCGGVRPATCCWSRNSLPWRHSIVKRAAARIFAKTSPTRIRNGSATNRSRWTGWHKGIVAEISESAD